ncbi:putative phage abortive infection protein [Mucilaginibacter sp. KACC 22063]|uniref:putative phage abortive infection protein n=1 Tax=Mucilaginibacter sp. KACC 22063 TaxID=3025666 RepID=UPI0023663CD5|nr:putative phage abortive infection protein [Mucilaginibacter sp. KACC 22063]WDF54890.1 putative phage abortive infection protein [Mucilaginibacter sp. KACC 22063]
MTRPTITLIFSLIIFLFFGIYLCVQNWSGWYLNFDELNNFGTLIGGIFSFISVILIYFTLQQQFQSFKINQFENRFFELIRYHRDNVSALKMRAPDTAREQYFEGHKVAREIHKQVLEMFDKTKELLKNYKLDDLYKDTETKLRDIENLAVTGDKNLLDLNYANISYLCVFFGGSEDGLLALRDKLSSKYNTENLNSLFLYIASKRAKWSKNHPFVKYYGGHQYRLGHLFRHLYQAVTYIDELEGLNYKEKYSYTKLLRAQLSTYEQSLLFFNSLSDLGRVWELKVELSEKEKLLPAKKQSERRKQKMLMTKYNFIRNIVNEFTIGISVRQFYPYLVFEGDRNTEERNKLEEIYDKKF